LIERAGGFTDLADRTRARVERRPAHADQDTAFLRLARENQEVLSESDRQYVKLRSRERVAVSADLGPILAENHGRDIPLLDGDRVIVPRRVLEVSVQGEVRSPGLVPFREGERASDYIRAAGGPTGRASGGKVRVTLARTGREIPAADAGPLHPGDIVWVPAKAERSSWVVVRDAIAIAAQVATFYLAIREATK
jgi:protein involved in polysaccharide export with SLBB domain